jgi:hypothetical protein
VSYLKAETFMLLVIYCESWWSVCTGCCGSVCYVVQLSAYLLVVAINFNVDVFPGKYVVEIYYK